MTQAARPEDNGTAAEPEPAPIPGARRPEGTVYGGTPPAPPTPGPEPKPPARGSARVVPAQPTAAPPDAVGETPPHVVRGAAQLPVYRAAPPPPRPQVAASAPVPPAAAAPPPVRKRRGGLVAVLVAVLILLGLTGGGSAYQLNRELPAATLTTDVASTMTIPGAAPSLPWPSQGSAELMIEGFGRLGGKGGGAPKAIGSVAKVMTAYVILKEHPITGSETGPAITVTSADVADYNRRVVSGQSLVPVRAGTKLTERDALEALMLPSANNVAHMLAVWDAGSEKAFIDKMNDAATELGMGASKYTDPSGFLPSTISTAADQVALARAALAMPVFAEIVALRSANIPVAGKILNYNDLLGVAGVFGIKTGSTTQAGGNLVFASRLKVGGRTLVVVGAVFNQPGAHTPEQLDRVNQEVRKLLNAVKRTVKTYTLLPSDPVGSVETAWGATAAVRPATPVRVVGWPGLSVPVKVTTTTPGPEITAGQAVGAVEAQNVRVELRADATTGEPDLWWKLSRRP